MEQVWDFFRELFDTSDFPPRWHCGRWSEFHGWFYIISDLLIWSAYFAIPLIIIGYITRQRGARFGKLYFLFASFILACGSTHFLDAITFWFPVYRLSALVRFFTGVISWVTVFTLIRVLPQAFTLKTAQQLESEVAQKEHAEEQLRISNMILMEAQEIAKIGHWEWDVLHDNIVWSKTLLHIYGVDERTKNLTYQEFLARVHPDDRDYVDEHIKKAIEHKVFREFYHRIVLPNGQVKTMHARGGVVLNEKKEVMKMIGTSQDVTHQKKVEQELLLKSQELEVMNAELQKFVSITSHDLREPLRKIITFSSLLEKDYEDTLEDKGKMYVEKITRASQRMQNLIDDVLEFSRLTGSGHTFTKVDINDVVREVLTDLEVDIESSHANIIIRNLPVIEANAGQLGRLFQNLISNAIKFRRPDVVPEIQISGEILQAYELPSLHSTVSEYEFAVLGDPKFWDKERFCKISVKDNGIGFDESYLDRIFLIFQRLHGRTDYEGTGIGLAICKKVADIHHGIITARSKPGEGASFIVILPVSQQNFRNLDKVWAS